MTGRVLIHRPGSLGDTVVALPGLRLVRKAFPVAELRIVTNAPVASSAPPLATVLDGMGLADGYFEYPVPLRDLGKAWRLARDIRRWRPDRLVYLARRDTVLQVRRDAAFFRACGIRDFIGLPLDRDRLENRQLPDGLREREAARLVRNLAPLGTIDLSDPMSWDLGLTETDRALPRRLIAECVGARPFIAISLGTKQVPNNWGIENWRIVAEQLCRLYPHKIVFTGAEDDRAPSDAASNGLGDRAVNLCGLNVRENAAAIAAASLFVGHDSGPMHLAAAVGTPLVAIFSRLFAPGIWFPMGVRQAVLYPPGESMQSITPFMVLDAIQAQLPAGDARRLAGEP